MAKHLVARDSPSVPSALDELLDTERQIAARNAEMAVECAALIEHARADAAALEASAATALMAELRALDDAAQRARDALVADLEADAARAMARYEQLSDDELMRLAELIAARVTGLSMPATGHASP